MEASIIGVKYESSLTMNHRVIRLNHRVPFGTIFYDTARLAEYPGSPSENDFARFIAAKRIIKPASDP